VQSSKNQKQKSKKRSPHANDKQRDQDNKKIRFKTIASSNPRAQTMMSIVTTGELAENVSTKSGELPQINKPRKPVIVKTLLAQCKEVCNSQNPQGLTDYDKVLNKVIARF